MDDKELVEVWRKQFEEWYDSHTRFNYGVAYYFGADGKYCFNDIELAWQSFLAAKRSQPAITVPAYDMHHYAPVRNLMAKMDAAGIKYTIGN